MLPPPDDLLAALERLINGTPTEADLTTLRRALLAAGEGSTLQIGKYNVRIGEGQSIQIGDRIYTGPNLETIRQALREVQERIAADEQARSLQAYFKALRRYCAEFPYIILRDVVPRRTLDEVYIPLHVKPHPTKKQPDGKTEKQELAPRSQSELTIAQALGRKERPHLLILGEPGAGKSTLLRQLAERAWDEPQTIGLSHSYLPLLVSLSDLARAEGGPETRLRQALGNALACDEFPSGFLRVWPKEMNVHWLLLLDGLDEVPGEERGAFLSWLEGFLAVFASGTRVIITTHPTGFQEGDLGRLEEQVECYDLLPFAPTEVKTFAQKWFGNGSTAFLEEWERLRGGPLSGTPLLLTLAAYVYSRSESKRLPKRRSGLYEQFITLWLEEAIAYKGLKEALGKDLCDLARPTLEHLALAMTEDSQKRGEVDLISVAAAYLGKALHLHPDKARAEGARFVREMGVHSGIFQKRNQTYDWIHPTFREYLAASCIVRECQGDLECVWQKGISRWWEEKSREVALLALGILSDAGRDVTTLAQRIWCPGLDIENLYFVGYALIEQVNVGCETSRQIISSLLTEGRIWRWETHAFEKESPFAILRKMHGYPQVTEGLVTLARDGKDNAVKALKELSRVQELLALAWDEQVSAEIRVAAVKALKELRRVQELLALAWDEQVSAEIRVAAVEASEELGRAEETVPALLLLVQDRRVNVRTRQRAVQMLEKLGHGEEAIPFLLKMAFDEHLEEMGRINAINALRRLGHGNDVLALARNEGLSARLRVWATGAALYKLGPKEATPILLTIARDTNAGVARMEAVDWLGYLGCDDDLLALAGDKEIGAYVRRHALEVLGKLGHVEDASEILLALASDEDVEQWERKFAAETLASLGYVDAASQVLLKLVQDKRRSWTLRTDAAEILTRWEREAEAAQAWLVLVRDEGIPEPKRRIAAEMLGKLGRDNDLRELMQNEQLSISVRVAVARALGRRCIEVTAILLATALNKQMSSGVRELAAEALDELECAEAAAQAWFALAQDEQVEGRTRLRGVAALGRLGRTDKSATILLELVCNRGLELWIRLSAAKKLSRLGRTEEAAKAWLVLMRERQGDEKLLLVGAQALGNLERMQDLLAMARDEQLSVSMRVAAIGALERFGYACFLPDLRHLASRETNQRVREALEKAIQHIHHSLT